MKGCPKLRWLIFIALITKIDFDFIVLDKDLVTVRKVVDALMKTMEEYANWDFNFIENKLIDNSNYFYKETAFLEIFLAFNVVQEIFKKDEPKFLD